MTKKSTCTVCDQEVDKVYDDICLDCHKRQDFASENGHGFHTPRGDWPDRPHIETGR